MSLGDCDAEIIMMLSYASYRGAFGEKEAAAAVGMVLRCGVVMPLCQRRDVTVSYVV